MVSGKIAVSGLEKSPNKMQELRIRKKAGKIGENFQQKEDMRSGTDAGSGPQDQETDPTLKMSRPDRNFY